MSGGGKETNADLSGLASGEAWDAFWQPVPKPRHHDIMALIREGKMRIEGDLEQMMAHFLTLKMMLEKPRLLGHQPTQRAT